MNLLAVGAFILLDTLFLLWYAPFLDLNFTEVSLFYNIKGVLPFLMNTSTHFLGQTTLGARAPFIVIHAINLSLIWAFSKGLVKRERDRWGVLALFALLPGVNSAALLVSKSGLIMMGALTFLLVHRYSQRYALLVLGVLSLCDPAFAYISLALFFYALSQKKMGIASLALLFFGVTMTLFGFDDGGRPKGYFLDTMGVFATIFSPLLFLFFVYALYRIALKYPQKELVWYIATTTFFLSLLFSFRQRVVIEEIAPLVVIALPLMVRVFFESYRTRLPQFRSWQTKGASLVVGLLTLTTLFSFWHAPLYDLVKEPRHHFAYTFHIPSYLAQALKERGITSVICEDEKLQFQLKFYGIERGGEKLSSSPLLGGEKVSIFYTQREIGTFYVTKVNN